MNTKIFSCLAAAALALGFSACSDDDWNPKTSKEGQLSLKSMALEVVDAQKDIETKKDVPRPTTHLRSSSKSTTRKARSPITGHIRRCPKSSPSPWATIL